MTSAVGRNDDELVVSGVGVVSPVGHTAAVSFGSMKAGLARIAESPEFRIRDRAGKRVRVTCASVSGVTDGHRRYLRHYRMAVRAFAELVNCAQLDDVSLAQANCYLVVSEPERPGFDDRIARNLLSTITGALGFTRTFRSTVISPTGHAGAFEALEAALDSIRVGRCERAVVGAVDAYLDEFTLEWLSDVGRLKSAENVKGFVPGEAAAFILVERAPAATARGACVLATPVGIGTAVEPNSIYAASPCAGDGLTSAIRTALTRSAASVSPAVAICDLNGERYRAHEWALALSRCFFSSDPPGTLWHPADCLGDCGAAAGVMNLAFGSLAASRRHFGPSSVLVWGSSDDGQRGAAILAPAARYH